MPEARGPVLVGYDGSDRARSAIAAVGRLLPGAEAVVVHVYEPPDAVSLSAIAPVGVPVAIDPETEARIERERREQALEVASAGVALAAEAGLAARPLAVSGSGTSGVWSALLAAADEHDAALIVVGARGHSGVASTLLGSVSDGVVHHARRPVLVVPARAAS